MLLYKLSLLLFLILASSIVGAEGISACRPCADGGQAYICSEPQFPTPPYPHFEGIACNLNDARTIEYQSCLTKTGGDGEWCRSNLRYHCKICSK